jgi:AhpD family alkylhydroperoxidase
MRRDTEDIPPRPARLAAPPSRSYPWYVRLIFALQRRKYGAELESARLWGRLPRSFLALTLLYRTLDRKASPIDAALRSLVQVRVSQINWCEFCVDLNGAAALERGVAPHKLEALGDFERAAVFTEREKAALAYAEAATDSTRRVDEAIFARLRGHFDEQAVLELTALVAFQNLSSKFNAALGVPAQGLCAPRVPPARH